MKPQRLDFITITQSNARLLFQLHVAAQPCPVIICVPDVDTPRT